MNNYSAIKSDKIRLILRSKYQAGERTTRAERILVPKRAFLNAREFDFERTSFAVINFWEPYYWPQLI